MSTNRQKTHRLKFRVAVIAVMAAVLGGNAAPAHAEACTTSGLQPRVIMTDTPGTIETQYCLGGEWTPTSRMQVSRGNTAVINEKVTDPRQDQYRFSNAADFFDLKKYDAYAIVQEVKKLAASGADLMSADHLDQALAVAIIRNQGLVNREGLHSNDGCRVRSVRWERAPGIPYAPPVSILPAGQPTTIDFAFAPGTSVRTQQVVLNALEQYSAAVAAQDSLMQYPERIVPHDPLSGTMPTITFSDKALVDAVGNTRIDNYHMHGSTAQVETATIQLASGASPFTVGHEIGHVFGLDHLPGDVDSVMHWQDRYDLSATPWNFNSGADAPLSVSFDPCMFRPAQGQ